MKVSIKKAIMILEDAERDFRGAPGPMINNNSGLCHYIRKHKLIKYYYYSDKRAYIKEILGNHYSTPYYTFCKGKSHLKVWTGHHDSLKNERSDWCKERLEYFRELLKQGKAWK